EMEGGSDVKAAPAAWVSGRVRATDIPDELGSKQKTRVDRRKVGTDTIKRIGRYQVPIELFQDVTAELRTLVVPEGGELPPEEELEAMEEAEAAEQAQAEEKHELDLDELDAAALAHDATLSGETELEASAADVD